MIDPDPEGLIAVKQNRETSRPVLDNSTSSDGRPGANSNKIGTAEALSVSLQR
jgi:hypothetical protein